MKAKGAIKGTKARAFAERAKKPEYTSMIKTHLMPILKPNKSMKIVDFCTGSGNIIPFFKNNVKEFIAIDASEEMIKILKENFRNIKNLKIIKSDVSKVPLASNKYDAVIIKFSLHHIADADPVIKEAYRILKKSGKFFIIDVVFDGSLLGKIRIPFMKLKKAFKNGFHEFFCKYRTNQQIEDLLSKNGFKLIKKINLSSSVQYFKKDKKHFSDYMYVAQK